MTTVTPNEARKLVLRAASVCNQTAVADGQAIMLPTLRLEYLHDVLMYACPGVPEADYAVAVDAALADAEDGLGTWRQPESLCS